MRHWASVRPSASTSQTLLVSSMSRISRRQFLKVLGVASFLVPPYIRQLLAQEKRPDILVIKGDPELALRRGFKLLGGVERFIKSGSRVLIKPNLSFSAPPEWGATTSPGVIRALSKICLDAGVKKVIVADHTIRSPDACFDKSGVREAIKDLDNVVLKDLNRERDYIEVEVPGKALKKTEIARITQKVDTFINLAQAKCHSATGVSLGMKGLMGLIWDRGYLHAQVNLHQAIGDLALVLKPDLVVVDATRVLLTKGPSGPGRVENPKEIIMGTDPVAVDSLAVSRYRWYGRSFKGSDVRHLIAAFENGAGEIDIEKLNVKEVTL
ncbi:MAG TPA: DUF362 domain-containing protein [bacterium (Candidatus Stahlbacteria)]|nr:DUF362 domain-containing protein [Candidatus Stahlbacteria bacterium]